MLRQRPYTFALTKLSLHFLLATGRRAIHSVLPVIRLQLHNASRTARFSQHFRIDALGNPVD